MKVLKGVSAAPLSSVGRLRSFQLKALIFIARNLNVPVTALARAVSSRNVKKQTFEIKVKRRSTLTECVNRPYLDERY